MLPIAEQVPGGAIRTRVGAAFQPGLDGRDLPGDAHESGLDQILLMLGRSPRWPEHQKEPRWPEHQKD